jgi:hypothetical protein
MSVKREKYINMYSNFFSYNERDMEKSKLIVNYCNNVYQGWYERWWTMTIIIQEEEKLKEVITIQMA